MSKWNWPVQRSLWQFQAWLHALHIYVHTQKSAHSLIKKVSSFNGYTCLLLHQALRHAKWEYFFEILLRGVLRNPMCRHLEYNDHARVRNQHRHNVGLAENKDLRFGIIPRGPTASRKKESSEEMHGWRQQSTTCIKMRRKKQTACECMTACMHTCTCVHL